MEKDMFGILADSLMTAVYGGRQANHPKPKRRRAWEGPTARDAERSFARELASDTRRYL